MIIGIGNDLVEVNRMEEAYNNSAFANKYFTDQEKSMIAGNFQRAAGNFAVKEAVSKVFGTGFRGFSPIDIEVLRDDLGKPYVNLYNKALLMANEMNIAKIHVAITNTKDYALSFVVGEGE